jgi:hypothetical protein
MAGTQRRIPENIIQALEEEQLPHETYLRETLARVLTDAGIDLTEEAAQA